MHILRSSLALARLVLAWFVLTLGAAGASPLLHPVALTVVCSESGQRVVAIDADGVQLDAHGQRHTLDCPLCLPAIAPPGIVAQALPRHAARDAAFHPAAPFRPTPPAGAPLPPRGPPRLY